MSNSTAMLRAPSVHPSGSHPANVLLLDFWSDSNRGDAAMQIGVVKLLRRQASGASLTVMAAFGANQWPGFVPELDETGPLVDDLVGGFYPTRIDFSGLAHASRWNRRFNTAVAALSSIFLLPFFCLAARFGWADRLVPSAFRSSVAALRACDLVIWNGRNFRADSPRRELHDIWQLVYDPIVAIASGKPIACIGASIWDLSVGPARRLLRRALGRTFFLSLREQSSYDRAEDLLRGSRTRTALLPDLSFVAIYDDAASADRGPCEADLQTVGLTLVDWPQAGVDGRQRYIDAVRGTLRHLLANASLRVMVVPQVTYRVERTDELAAEIIRGFPNDRISVMTGRPSVSELLATYASVDMLIATRMHSAIFALSQGTPVVTIPYDEGGKWGILDMMGAHNISVPYSQVDAETLIAKVAEVWRRRDELMAAVAAQRERLLADASQNVSLPLSMYATTLAR